MADRSISMQKCHSILNSKVSLTLLTAPESRVGLPKKEAVHHEYKASSQFDLETVTKEFPKNLERKGHPGWAKILTR